ncbi:cytochrome c [Altericroceibacterium xinjiangense]|uniref:cytochrome c n=1 Tax=Altericroceibacterium xinjiangense TaxID=762261 RepID=UPI0013DF0C98|nr:cytochrome c [Altericroceibacterium xinjiangense]
MRGWMAAAMIVGMGLTSATASSQSALPRISVREAMADHINPATLAVWDVTNTALADDGGLDPRLMDDAAWEKLAGAASVLHSDAALLSAQPKLQVVQPGREAGQSIAESAYSAEQIQRFIDADPAAFREMAQQLSLTAAELAKAAQERDARRAGETAGQIDALCESCHQKFWYPET